MGIKENLGYFWKADFDDGSSIEQFSKAGKEVLFKKVLDKEDQLEKFSVINSDDEKEAYLVNLSKKTITGPNVNYTLKGTSPKLIYFRRNSVRREIGSGAGMSPMVVHHLGLKTSTQEKKLEVFKGIGARPKKIEYSNVKTAEKVDLTSKAKIGSK